MPNITTNHAITYTNSACFMGSNCSKSTTFTLVKLYFKLLNVIIIEFISTEARRGLTSGGIISGGTYNWRGLKRGSFRLLTFTASRMVDTGVVLKSSAVAEPLPALIVVCRTARTAHWILIRWTLIITFTATAISIICFADSKSRALHVKTRIYVYVKKRLDILVELCLKEFQPTSRGAFSRGLSQKRTSNNSIGYNKWVMDRT